MMRIFITIDLKAVSVKRAEFFCRQLHDLLSTELSVDLSVFGCIQDMLVVVVDNLFSVIHATVTDLDGIAVEDFSEFVLFREVFVY